MLSTITKPKMCLIVAVDNKYGISKNGKIPWHIKGDYDYFYDTTTRTDISNEKNVILMGKNTWIALPRNIRSLKNRINIVLSPDTTQQEIDKMNTTKEETHVMRSLRSALDFCSTKSIPKLFVCGGKYVYDDTLKNISFDEMYISKIDNNYNCDNLLGGNLLETKMGQFKHIKYTDEILFDKNINQFVKVSFNKFTNEINDCNAGENEYLKLMKRIIHQGQRCHTRNGITRSLFGETLTFNLADGFPLITTKKVFMRGVSEELAFFLRGDTDTNKLSDIGINIWRQNTSRQFLDATKLNAYGVGDMGPMYGYQWRYFNKPYYGSHNRSIEKSGFDQLQYCIDLLKHDPQSRRIIMTSYNPIQANQGVLFPCHGLMIQFNVGKDHELSCAMTQRSADYICGVPFNIASYSMLIHLICNVINNDPTYNGKKFIPGKLLMNLGNVHIYDEHINVANRQILREPYKFPKITFKNKITSLQNIRYDDVTLENYNCYPTLHANMIA